MRLQAALQNANEWAELLNISLQKDYRRFLEFKNKCNFSDVRAALTENFFLLILAILTLLLPFLVKKAISWLLSYAKANKSELSRDIAKYKFTIKENPCKISLLRELNFCKSFYTPA